MLLDDLLHVLLLRDYNTALVVGSTAILGAGSGVIGTFLLLRKRALMADALSHATLPGIAIAFLVMVAFGGSGKSLWGLLLGAFVFGLLGVGAVVFVRSQTRLKDDAAMGIVLSVSFGLGIALLGIITEQGADAAGLAGFITGKTASMVMQDFLLISIAAAAVACVTLLLMKELTLLSFDEEFAGALGWKTTWLELLLLGLVAAMTVIGLQAVGLILMIALFIIPAASARFWTERLKVMLILATIFGAGGGWLGSSVSALADRLPAGAIIVLACSAIFLISLLFGSERGVVKRILGNRRTSQKIAHQHLLRAIYELLESRKSLDKPQLNPRDLLSMRSWPQRELKRLINSAERRGLLICHDTQRIEITTDGLAAAARTTRNHRLWETYLIEYADIAPSHVDRDADMIEHVLDESMITQLEVALSLHESEHEMLYSPHKVSSR